MPADTTLTRNWLKMLAAFQIGRMEPEEVEWRLAVLAPALAEEFPDEVFTPDSARAVARASGAYFPVFGEICEALAPIAKEVREAAWWRKRLADRAAEARKQIEDRAKAAEPYELSPAPEWCFERESRHMGRMERGELTIQKPIRTPEEQIAILLGEATPQQQAQAERYAATATPPAANADAAPLRAAAADMPREVVRGPVLEEDDA